MENQEQKTPFDQIKYTEGQGQQYWTAKDLQALYKYNWRSFKRIIAKVQPTLSDEEIVSFQEKGKKRPQGGYSQETNFKLSARAAYYISLTCNSKKSERIVEGRNYFSQLCNSDSETVNEQRNEQRSESAITAPQEDNHQEQGGGGFSQEELENLFDGWLEQEKNGVQFPVDFDTAWPLAGYATKANARRALPKSSQGEIFIRYDEKSGKGRPQQKIYLSCDGLKHLCLMADTKQGEATRQYFIEVEKNWKLVQQKHPDVAQDVELEKLKFQSEIAKHKCEETKAQERIMKTSESIMKIHGAKMLALMMGNPDAVVEKVEYRDRTVMVNENLQPIASFEGEGITSLAQRWGFGKGKKANEACRNWLRSIGITEEQWIEEMTAHSTPKLPRELVEKADQEWANGNGER